MGEISGHADHTKCQRPGKGNLVEATRRNGRLVSRRILFHRRWRGKKKRDASGEESLSFERFGFGLLSGGQLSGLFGEGGGLVGSLPGKLRLGAAEVAVGGGLLVDGAAKI